MIFLSKAIDITGQTFDRWLVLSRAENNTRGETMWNCRCSCGNEKIVQGYSLRKGLSKSCGCLQKEIVFQTHFEDLTNQTFNHLTILEYAGKDKSDATLWKCQCDCNAKTIIIARAADIKKGKTTSCGCVKSIGEEKISLLLTEANLPFIKEKTFETCRFLDTNALAKFDFYVNNSYLIEYDGIQHFKPTFGEELFTRTKEHDKYKNEWCKKNNIPLIRISYDQLKNLTIKDLTI